MQSEDNDAGCGRKLSTNYTALECMVIFEVSIMRSWEKDEFMRKSYRYKLVLSDGK